MLLQVFGNGPINVDCQGHYAMRRGIEIPEP